MTPGSGSPLAYSFDASGNLTTLPTGAAGSYDEAGELTSSSPGGGSITSYTYNPDGERLSATQGATTLAAGRWNGATELTSYRDTAANMTAASYDGAGLRVSTGATPAGGSAATQSFVGNTQAAVPQVLMDSGNAYIYTRPGTPAEQVSLSAGTVTYLVTDDLGSVRGTVNNSGSLTSTTSYDAWGNAEPPGGLAAATPFGHAGGYTDQTGLIYLLNRYYDPASGLFLSGDPAIAQTLQPYAYANGNRVSQADPSGEYPAPATLSTAGEASPDVHIPLDKVSNWSLANVNGTNNGYSPDCTDFASRALHFGGNDPESWPMFPWQYTDDHYWFNGQWAGIPIASYSWVGCL